MTRLAVVLRDHSGPIEADLARFYPRDADQLCEFLAGRMSVRRLNVLVDGLPPGAGLWRALGVDDGWSQEAHLIAAVVRAVQGERMQIRTPSEIRAAEETAQRHLTRAQAFRERQQAREAEGEVSA
jgi:hypothetical protein